MLEAITGSLFYAVSSGYADEYSFAKRQSFLNALRCGIAQ
jgi:hypothetical protein